MKYSLRNYDNLCKLSEHLVDSSTSVDVLIDDDGIAVIRVIDARDSILIQLVMEKRK
jgi:hypothetical protein